MVYKWSSTDMCVRCFGVQEHRLPYRGVAWWTQDRDEHGVVLPI